MSCEFLFKNSRSSTGYYCMNIRPCPYIHLASFECPNIGQAREFEEMILSYQYKELRARTVAAAVNDVSVFT